MIIGTRGTGKSTIVNNILYNGEDVAKKSYCDIGEIGKIKNEYRSKEIPFLKLIDTKGIEIQQGFISEQFFTHVMIQQLTDPNTDNFFHCILYCVNPDRLFITFNVEMKLINELTRVSGTIRIPVIIVLAQSVNKKRRIAMKNYLKSKNFEYVVDILAKRVIDKGIFLEQYGLDDLLNLTIKICKKGYDGNMKFVWMKGLTEYFKRTLISEDLDFQSTITNIMKRETYEKDLANQDFENYINNIYLYNIFFFR